MELALIRVVIDREQDEVTLIYKVGDVSFQELLEAIGNIEIARILNDEKRD